MILLLGRMLVLLGPSSAQMMGMAPNCDTSCESPQNSNPCKDPCSTAKNLLSGTSGNGPVKYNNFDDSTKTVFIDDIIKDLNQQTGNNGSSFGDTLPGNGSPFSGSGQGGGSPFSGSGQGGGNPFNGSGQDGGGSPFSGSGQDGGDSPFNSPGQDGGSPFGSTTPGEGIPPFSPPPGPGVKPRKVPKILPITPLVKRVPASPTIKLLPLHTHSILHDNTVTVTVLTTVMNYVPVVYTSMVEHPPATIRMPPEVLTVTPPPETVSVTPEPVIIRVPGPTVRMSPVTLTSIKTLPPKIIRPEPVTMTVEKAKILPPQTMLRVVPVLQSPKLVIVRAPPITIQEPATTVYVFSTVRSPPETFVQVQTKLQVLTSTILKLVQREPRTIFRTVVPRVVVQPRSTVPRPVPVSPRWGQLPGSGTPRTNRPSNGTPKGHPPGAPTGSVSGLGSNNIGGYNLEEITPPGSSDRIFRFVGTPPLGGASSHPFTPVTSTAIVPGGGPSRYSRSTGPWTGPRPMGPPSGRTGNGTQACSSSVFGSAAQKRPNNGGNCINGGILAFGPPRPQQCSNCSTNGNQNCMFGQMAGSYTASTGACGPSKQPDGNYNECMSDISRCKGPEVEQPSSNLRKPISRDDSDRNDEDDESGPSNGEDNDNADQDEVFLSDLVNNS